MCKRMFLLIAVVLLLVGSAHAASAPAAEWTRSYNGSEEESHPHYVIETSDGGFLMVGETGFIDNVSKKRGQAGQAHLSLDYSFFGRPRGRSVDSRPSVTAARFTQSSLP